MTPESRSRPPASRRLRRPWWRSRWWPPAYALALGAIVFAAFVLGGNAGDGAKAAAVFVLLAAGLAIGTKSDTLQGLGGPGRDERWAMIDLRASALAGLVMVLVLVGSWLWEIAHGDDGSPYGQLAAVGGIAYILAVALLRWRS
jgi:hypothetical protein